jgi:hypothetical protein
MTASPANRGTIGYDTVDGQFEKNKKILYA